MRKNIKGVASKVRQEKKDNDAMPNAWSCGWAGGRRGHWRVAARSKTASELLQRDLHPYSLLHCTWCVPG